MPGHFLYLPFSSAIPGRLGDKPGTERMAAELVPIQPATWAASLTVADMACAAFFLPLHFPTALVIMEFAVLAGLARIPISHHTPAQVIAGWAYGFGATSTLIWMAGMLGWQL